jgi:hypothetical protein
MLPRFDDTLMLEVGDKKKLTAMGPFSLMGNETDAYFWLRVSQETQGGDEIDAVLAYSMEEKELNAASDEAAAKLKAAVDAAIAGTVGVPRAEAAQATEQARAAAEEAAASIGPRWGPAFIDGDHEFHTGPATAEAWLMLRTKDGPASQTYWTTAVTLTSVDSS